MENNIERYDFIYSTDQLEYLLVIYYHKNTKGFNYKLMDPYNLDDFMDITEYFTIENECENILFGPILPHGKITIVIDNQLYIKEIINEEKLDGIQQKIHSKNNYYLQEIQEIFEMPKFPKKPAEFTIETGKSIKWSYA